MTPPCKVTVVPIWEVNKIEKRKGLAIVSTVSNSAKRWESGLSPFILGPCELYGGFVSKTMENAWQYSKVYPKHNTKTDMPKAEYWEWAQEGWNNPKAVRYPMGRFSKPEYSWWDGLGFGYIEARKRIYAPLYLEAVMKTDSWEKLKGIYEDNRELCLIDYDAYCHRTLHMTLSDVLNNPNKKMGHAFVLMMALIHDPALEQLHLRGKIK